MPMVYLLFLTKPYTHYEVKYTKNTPIKSLVNKHHPLKKEGGFLLDEKNLCKSESQNNLPEVGPKSLDRFPPSFFGLSVLRLYGKK
jgi:hypothetical protein